MKYFILCIMTIFYIIGGLKIYTFIDNHILTEEDDKYGIYKFSHVMASILWPIFTLLLIVSLWDYILDDISDFYERQRKK